MAAKEFIVAIELGSSKMTGIAGQKNGTCRCKGELFCLHSQRSGL